MPSALASAMATDPLTGAVTQPSDAVQTGFGKVIDGLIAGAKNWATLPGRAYQEGITPDQAVDWAAPTAMGMVGMARMPGATPAGALGSSGAKLVQPEGIRAYHGSPHDFDAFDLSKIGTGEGAQAYGHGLYFAEAEPVAKGYRDRLSANAPYLRGGQQVLHPELYSAMENAALATGVHPDQAGGVTRQILKLIEKEGSSAKVYGNYNPPKGFERAWDAALDTARDIKWNTNPGHMYEVNINAKPEQFLDWDKPLAQQNDAVRGLVTGDAAALRQRLDQVVAEKDALAADRLPSNQMRDEKGWHQLAKEAETIQGRLRSVVTDDLPGQLAYYRMAGQKLQSPEASAKLLDRGIPGIRYLDQGSRTAGAGSSNYVVFNPKIIDIMRKYGLAGIPGASAVAAAMNDQQQQ